MIHTPSAFIHDGATLRAFNRDREGGSIKPLDDTFTIRRDPLHAIGFGFALDPRRNLDALLSGAGLVTLPDPPAHQKARKSAYRDHCQDLELTVWLDTTHGYLPRRIEVFKQGGWSCRTGFLPA